MAPDDILEQPDLADPTLNLACDPIGRLVVAVRIVSPANENGSRVKFPHAINDRGDGALGLFAFMGDKAIRQPKEKHVLRFQPKRRARSFRFHFAERRQPVRRIGFAVRMRPGAVADDNNLPTQILPAGLGDQAAAAQALIVRMGRDNDERPILERLTQRPKRQPLRGAQEFVHRHRHRSCAVAGCARIHAAASVSARSGPGWRR